VMTPKIMIGVGRQHLIICLKTSFLAPFFYMMTCLYGPFSDGLTDCEDPECCGQGPCEHSQLCVASKKPIDILLRKQPPAITASFHEKMKFLIEEGSLQNYARPDSFNGRLVLHHVSCFH